MNKDVLLTEVLSDEQIIEKSFGLALIKPDSVDLGIDEFIADYMSDRMKKEAYSDLVGGFVVDSISEKQLRLIYPNLNDSYFKGNLRLFRNPSALLVFTTFKYNYDSPNLWEAIIKIKGHVDIDKRGQGFRSTIRGAIPIPGTLTQCDTFVRNRKNSIELTDEEYYQLSRNFVHSPANLEEILGLSMLMSDDELYRIVDKRTAKLVIDKRRKFKNS